MRDVVILFAPCLIVDIGFLLIIDDQLLIPKSHIYRKPLAAF